MASLALVLPKSQYPAFADFVGLTADQRQRLFDELQGIVPALDLEEVTRRLVRNVNIPFQRLYPLMDMLRGMYAIRLDRKLSAEVFAQQICDFVATLSDAELKPADHNWEPIRQSIASLLNLEGTLGIIAKAYTLTVEFERLFHDARVITDVRPLFPSNVTDPPTAAVIVHTLRIKYYDTEGEKEFYVTLDSTDLKDLKEAAQRALDKDGNLRTFLREKMVCLEEESA